MADQEQTRSEEGLNENGGYDTAQAPEEQQDRSGKLETVFTVISVVLICAIGAHLTMNSIGTQTPAQLSVEAGYPEQRGDFAAVELLVKNEGEEAVKAVHVTGAVKDESGEKIEANATVDWLPGKSKRSATLLFPKDAISSSPVVQLQGYEEP